MIRLRFMGHIRTSMGKEETDIEVDEISVDGLFGMLRAAQPQGLEHGFTKFNTLMVVNDMEVFSAASQRDRLLRGGDDVLLVPFSHGG